MGFKSLGTLSSHFRLPAIFGKAIAREKDIKILPRTHFNKELSSRVKKDPGGSLGLNAYNADDDTVILWANFEARIASYRPARLASFPKRKLGRDRKREDRTVIRKWAKLIQQ